MQDAARLIEPLIPGLRRYACCLTGALDEADDLVQDCLERAIGRWGQRRPDGEVRAWLFAILHNLAMSGFRRRRRRGVSVPLDQAPAASLARPPGQEDAVRHTELLKALAALPEEHRSILLLICVEDFTYAEAASTLGVPIGTVMSRLSRARERLRRAMDGDVAERSGPALRRVT